MIDNVELLTLHLFAGAGGGILADEIMGFRTVGAVELEEYPRRALLARQADGCLPKFPIWDDVCTFRADNQATRDYIDRLRQERDRLCICGGFPCQDISAAGKGAGITGARSGLGGMAHGLANWLDKVTAGRSWDVQEHGLPRLAEQCDNRRQRLRAIGNGQVPLCAAVAFVTLLKQYITFCDNGDNQ